MQIKRERIFKPLIIPGRECGSASAWLNFSLIYVAVVPMKGEKNKSHGIDNSKSGKNVYFLFAFDLAAAT